MRILFVIRDMVTGGAGKQLALIAGALSKRKHDVFVFTYYGGETQYSLAENVRYVAQNPMPRNKFSEYFFSPWNIRKQIKKIKPDCVISWRCNAGCFTVLGAAGMNVKTIFSERSDPFTETSVMLKLSSLICTFSDGGVFQLERVRQYYRRLYKKSVVIHNPINETKDQILIPYEKRKQKIVHVGRMMLSQKRQDVMLDAFKIFFECHPDYTLHFFGDGQDLESVKKMALEKGLSDCVIFHGAVGNILESIKDAKMLVLTSDYEGIPNVILEAFVAGVPVVSTDCSPGGARVLIDDGVNGFLASVADPLTIAKKMMELTSSKAIANRFIVNGKHKLRQFDVERIVQKWEEYLKNILSVS